MRADSDLTLVVSNAEWESRKAFVGFDERAAELLAAMKPWAESSVEEIVDQLYERLRQVAETRQHLRGDIVETRLRASQSRYFVELFRGEYGEAYLHNRLRVGRAHHRIGLSPRWYVGTYAIYMELAVPRLRAALADEPERIGPTVDALYKLICLDQDLALTTYTAARDRVIEHQLLEIRELSTPVIRVWDDILLLPLVGALDTQRATLLTEHLLEAIVRAESQVAILDVTGVPVIDTVVARHIMDTIAAAEMLGARVVVTGISPSTAMTITRLGIDISRLNACGNLKAGMRAAFAMLGKRVVRREAKG